MIVSEKYRRDYEDIQETFVLLFDEVTELFENDESVTMSELKTFFSFYPDMEDPLCNTDTIVDVMVVVQNQYSSFLCCTCLEHAAEQFKITSAVKKINDYYKSVDEFCQHVLRHHSYMQPFVTAESVNMTINRIIFKLQWSPDSKTLSNIEGLLRKAFRKLSVHVHVMVIGGGSVRVITGKHCPILKVSCKKLLGIAC